MPHLQQFARIKEQLELSDARHGSPVERRDAVPAGGAAERQMDDAGAPSPRRPPPRAWHSDLLLLVRQLRRGCKGGWGGWMSTRCRNWKASR